MEVYEVIFSSPELKTVSDYVREPGSPASKYIDREEEFLQVKNKEGKTNKEVIINRFKQQSLKDKYNASPAKEIPLKIGTKLAIPAKEVDRVGLLTQGIEVVSNSAPAFKARMLAELEMNEGYNPARKIKPVKGLLNAGITSEIYPEVTVWIWCKGLSKNVLSADNDGEIFNITPFVQKVSTNVGKNGGNFQITLPPLECEFSVETNKWIIKRKSLINYVNDSKNLSQQNDGYVAESHLLYEDKDGEVRRSQFLFHNILSSNDLVFIRFETLQLEKQQRIDDNKDFIINKNQIPGRIYDMIGLIDENTQIVSGANNDVSINISGRDLSKLFIEDGTYFYALEMSQGQLNFAGASTQKNQLMQRVFSDNALQYFGLYYNNSIENVLKFVIQQLSTIKVIPDSLFEYYGDRRNKKFNIDKEKTTQKQTISDQLEKYKKESKQYIAGIRKKAQLTNQEKTVESKEIDTAWNQIYEFLKAIRDNNVRKVEGNTTIGWDSFRYQGEQIIQNTLPSYFIGNMHLTLFYTKSNVIKPNEDKLFITIDQYIDLEKSTPDHLGEPQEEFATGIWQIIKLVIDDGFLSSEKNVKTGEWESTKKGGVTNRRIVDSSASSANGSLLNFIRKVCQEPFVEFYMDTYGDMYHLIARRPPTDREGLRSMLEGQVSVENKDGSTKIQSTVIDIEIEDVIQEQLSYNDINAISWYQLTPQANFIGNSSTYSLAYLPAIFFQEYADIWGSRPLQITHNYMPRLPLDTQRNDLDVSEKQAFEDLKYLVESNAYMPFTRQGTITINGDRRMKVGNICRYKPTGEIFFIDDVQQTYSIGENSMERTTTIEVSRGMVESLIYGIQLEDKNNKTFKPCSYFDIINTELNLQEKTVSQEVTEQVKVGTKVVQVAGIDNNQYSTESNLQVNALFAAANRYKGYKYELGSTGQGGKIDCSGFVSKVLQIAGVNIARDTSENIMTRSNNFRQVFNLDESMLREGDVIGLDRKDYAFDKGRKYGIDHIMIVVRNYNTGKLELAESVGGTGVRFKPLSEIIPYYSRTSRRVYLGDFRSGTGSGSSVEEPVYKNQTRTITRKEVDRANVFSNFIVFKEAFNFFVRRMQNSPQYVGRVASSELNEVVIKKN